MSRSAEVIILLSAFLLPGCGARTGLLWAPEADAGVDDGDMPDVFGAYPCNYGATGEFAPLLPEVDISLAPRLEWGDDRLAVSFWVDDYEPHVGVCTTRTEEDLRCLGYQSPSSSDYWPGDIAWNGESFGFCWSEEHGGYEFSTYFMELSPRGEPLSEEVLIAEGDQAMCRQLEWVGDHYLALSWSGFTPLPVITSVRRLARDGRELGSAVPELDPLETGDIPMALAADGSLSAMAWVEDGEIVVHAVDGLAAIDGGVFVEGVEAIALALRGPIACLLWSERQGPNAVVYAALLDMNHSRTGQPIEVGAVFGTVIGLDVIGVYEGFMTARIENSEDLWTQRVVAVPLRANNEGLELERRWDMVLHEGEPSGYGTVGPSLGYDGTDVYLAASVLDPDTYLPKVHIQRLACHR